MSALNPWLTIWTSPRRTIRSIVDTNPEQQMLILVVLGGLALTLSNASSRNAADSIPLPFIFLLAAIGGPSAGSLGSSFWVPSMR